MYDCHRRHLAQALVAQSLSIALGAATILPNLLFDLGILKWAQRGSRGKTEGEGPSMKEATSHSDVLCIARQRALKRAERVHGYRVLNAHCTLHTSRWDSDSTKEWQR